MSDIRQKFESDVVLSEIKVVGVDGLEWVLARFDPPIVIRYSESLILTVGEVKAQSDRDGVR